MHQRAEMAVLRAFAFDGWGLSAQAQPSYVLFWSYAYTQAGSRASRRSASSAQSGRENR